MISKLYYGNGSCTIEGSNIRVVAIKFRGAIEINDKTSDSFAITYQNNSIVIFPTGEGALNDLFNYVGEFKIISVKVVNNVEKVPTSIHRVMDYTELLNSNSEDMTTKSENLSATYVSGRKVAKTILKQPYLPNQHTSNLNTSLHLSDGTKYDGYCHIHLTDVAVMTGKEHTEDSQDLYFINGKPTRNPSLAAYGAVEAGKRKRAWELRRGRRK
jgi:hypothetical protein